MVVKSTATAASPPVDRVTQRDELEDHQGDQLVVVTVLEGSLDVAAVHVSRHVREEEEHGHEDADALGRATVGS